MTKYGPAGFRGPGVEDAGDVDMVHHGQGLPLGLEAGDDLPAVHARLDDLEGDLALHGLGLLGHVDGAHAALADLLQQLVRADHRAGALGDRQLDGGANTHLGPNSRGGRCGSHVVVPEKAPDLGVRRQESIHAAAQFGVGAAGLVQVGGTLGRIDLGQGGEEDGLGGGHLGHGRSPHGVVSPP